MAQATRIELAYLAGIFDGEGCILISRTTREDRPSPTYRLNCSVGMCNLYIPQLFMFRYGGHMRTAQKGNNRRVWTWQVEGPRAGLFCKELLPYLRLKRNEAELAIRFQDDMDNQGLTSRKGCKGLKGTILIERQAQKILMSKMKDKTKEGII